MGLNLQIWNRKFLISQSYIKYSTIIMKIPRLSFSVGISFNYSNVIDLSQHCEPKTTHNEKDLIAFDMPDIHWSHPGTGYHS